jgi:hypothetical protein
VNRSACLLLGLVALASSEPVVSQAQAPGVAAKRYPWDTRPPQCFQPHAKPSRQCRPDDWPNYAESKRRVDHLILDPDYDLIQRAENELGFSRKRFASGQYYFDAWFLSLDSVLALPNELVYRSVSGWARAKGENGYVKLAEARLRYSEAWKARGPGEPNTVTREGWDVYLRKLREADQALDSGSNRLKRTGPWYVMKLRVAYQLPELEGSREPLLQAGSKLWPEYTKIYATAMAFSSPMWGGEFEEVDRIARFAVERTKAKWGASFYPLVYQEMFRSGCGCTVTESEADWDLMKQGFRDYEALRRSDEGYFRAFASLACAMRDRPETRRLLDLADKLSPNRPAGPPDSCREFAYSST